MTDEPIAAKRARERAVVGQMVRVYCRGNHKDERTAGGVSRDGLCPECAELARYADARIGRCPFIATKTFCSQCRVHCYAPAQRQAIKDVMRYAGPRMLLRYPVMTVHHGIDTLRAKRG